MSALGLVAAGLAHVLAWLVATGLLVIGARRAVFALAGLLPVRPLAVPSPGHAPSVLLLFTAWNERAVVDAGLAAIEKLDYPADRLELTLIDHGSTDRTGAQLESWATKHRGQGSRAVRTMWVDRSLPQLASRSAALAAGLASSARTDLVAIVDADLQLLPDALTRLAAAFADERVGAVSGYARPSNASATVVSRYAALETWVHQLLAASARDRLALDPPPLCAWMIRRAALDRIGGFPICASGEDVRIANALAACGIRTRFTPAAVGETQAARSLDEYWWQHLRWARDVYQAGATADGSAGSTSPARAPASRGALEREGALVALARRADRALSAAGYADRLALVAAIGMAAAGLLSPLVPASYVAVGAAEVAVALHLARVGGVTAAASVVASCVPMVIVDVIATMAAALSEALHVPHEWRHPRRRSQSGTCAAPSAPSTRPPSPVRA